MAALTPVPYRALVGRTARRARHGVHDDQPLRCRLLTKEAKALIDEYAGTDESIGIDGRDRPASFNFPYAQAAP